jgi:hypothetical protein
MARWMSGKALSRERRGEFGIGEATEAITFLSE